MVLMQVRRTFAALDNEPNLDAIAAIMRRGGVRGAVSCHLTPHFCGQQYQCHTVACLLALFCSETKCASNLSDTRAQRCAARFGPYRWVTRRRVISIMWWR